MDVDDNAGSAYVLGHTPGELRRLAIQASLIDPITRRFVGAAGITEGMRVLDIGSGGGHVAFLVADLIGSAGRVVGVDRSPTAVEAARAGARARSLANVEFQAGDPAEMVFDELFDAVVGRFVLQFQVDPVSVLRGVARHVRPGGSVVFHELDWGGIWSFPPAPLHDRCCAWAMETIRRSGAETNMGLKPAFDVCRGRPARARDAHGGGDRWRGAGSTPRSRRLAGLVETLGARDAALGRGHRRRRSSQDSLLDRMLNEVRTTNSVVLGRLQVGCWARR